MYQIVLSRSAEKDLHKLPVAAVKKISKEIDALSENPRPQGSKKFKGTDENLWRVRVGDYRIIY